MEDMDVVDNDDGMPPHRPVLRRQNAYNSQPAFEEVLRYIQQGGDNIPQNDIISQGWPGVLFEINQGGLLYNFNNDQIDRKNIIENIFNGLQYNFRSKKSPKKTKKTKKSVRKSPTKTKKTKKSVRKSTKKTKKSVRKSPTKTKKTKKSPKK